MHLNLPAAWWASFHAMALFLAGTLLATLLLSLAGGAAAEGAGLALRRAAASTEPLLFALLLLGALLGLHGRPHRATWAALCGLAVLGVALGFLGDLLPWGQLSFAAAPAQLPAAALRLLPQLLPLALLAVLLHHLARYWSLRHPLALALAPIACLALLALALPPAPPAFAPRAEAPANPLATPAHILPESWLLPFYAILRAPAGKTAGVIALFAALAPWVALPWLDRHAARPIWERPATALVAGVIAACLLVLLLLGAAPASPLNRALSLAAMTVYFAAFLAGLPLAARRLPGPPPGG